MRLKITNIGNSRGVRIPKPVIEQCGFEDAVEARVIPEGLLLAPQRKPRAGWKQSFHSSSPDGELLLGSFPNKFDSEEWEW